MFRILHRGRAVLHRAALSNTSSLVLPTSSKYRWKDTFYREGLRTKIHTADRPKFIRYNLKPHISAAYLQSFIKYVYNLESTMNPVVREKVEEMITDWDFNTVERQILRELQNGAVDLHTVMFVVKLMLAQDYLPEYLINGILNFATDNLKNLIHHKHQASHATELAFLGFICCQRVSDSLLLQLQNYLHTNYEMFQIHHIRFFYLLFQKTRWIVTHPLNQIVVDKMLKEMPDLHHNEILNIFKSLMISHYYDLNGVEKLAASLLENNKILSLSTDQQLNVYLYFFASRNYYDETLYDSLLEAFYFLVNTLKVTNIQSTALILSTFGGIQFKPKKAVYREICAKMEKICLDTNYKPTYFSENEWVSEFIDGMTYFGFFSDDLLNRFFSSISRIPDNSSKRTQYGYLHYTVLIEHPSYDGPTMPSHMIRRMEVDTDYRIKREQQLNPENNVSTIYDTVCDMLGEDYVHWYHILPHFNYSDIEIRLNTDGSVVAFQPETYLQRVAADFEDDTPEVKRVVLMFLYERAFMPGSPNLKGRFAVKIRQLQTLGYHILTISKDDLIPLTTEKARRDFLTELIESNFDVKLKLPEEKMKQV